MKKIVNLTATLFVVMISCVAVSAGDHQSPAGEPSSTMVTLQDIYDKVTAQPCTGAVVVQTGQTESYNVGDDGDFKKGLSGPNPRFTDNSDGTVTDNQTGLIWLKNANPDGLKIWTEALGYCNSLADPAAGLTDGSVAGDWRLPNIKELQSLIDVSQYNADLPSSHLFNSVQSGYYWFGNSYAATRPDGAWNVLMRYGYVFSSVESYSYYLHYVWPVRCGND